MHKANLKLGSVSLIAVLAGLTVSQPALAQDEADSASEGLGAIIVTAQRRAETLQDAGLPVAAVSGNQLVEQGVTDVTNLTNLVPAIQINTLYGATPSFSLRGVGNFVANVNSETAVIVNLDGVPVARPTGVAGQFFDLERVEVLKGPQGTLYGRNATGGAINFISRQPDLSGSVSGYANFSYGNYDAIKFDAAVNLPVAQDVAIRVAGMSSTRDGFYSDGTGDEDIKGIRATMLARVSDGVSLTLSGNFTHSGGKGTGSTWKGLDKFIGMEDSRGDSLFVGQTIVPISDVPGAVPAFQDNDFWGFYAKLEIDTPLGVVTFQPSYRKSELDFLGVSNFHARVIEDSEQTTAELRLVSDNDSAFEYIFGAFYMDEDNVSQVNFNQQTFANYTSLQPSSKAWAGYARLTYHVTDDMRLIGGIRYTDDKRSTYQDNINVNILGCFLPTPCVNPVSLDTSPPDFVPFDEDGNLINGQVEFPEGNFFPDDPMFGPLAGAPATSINGGIFEADKKFTKFTWRAAAEYDVTPDSLLYVSYETGFKAGGFYNTTAPERSFDPETVGAFTLGSKNRFMNDRLQVNVEAFHWTYKDRQLSFLTNDSEGVTTFVTRNVGKVVIQGAELDLLARVTRNTMIGANVQYLDTELKDFVYEQLAGGAGPNTGCAVTNNGPVPGSPFSNYTVNCNGKAAAYSPKWTLSGNVEQTVPLQNGADLVFSAQGRYQSSSINGFDFLPQQEVDGYFVGDLGLNYESNEGFYIAAFVRNVTDKVVASNTQKHPYSGTLFAQVLSPPRTYGVRVGVEF
ncbi:TonB-dependent receptor [Croceicoccus bisphenolivorans]|uniref:TonB-dependent receptor n=1 Tax=Croceicoccus bisphenolivorans TaxID=1783232 RepID=UPI0008353846|nr:TonB-dependent receptor [Croceicoccus bisphenolivorans]